MSVELTLEDRHYISMYARRLPCTVALRFKIDRFFRQLEVTPDEIKKYEVKIDEDTHQFSSLDENYKVKYEEFPQEVISAMKNFTTMLIQSDRNKTNEMVKRIIKYFGKIS